jgi:hypothetical protein
MAWMAEGRYFDSRKTSEISLFSKGSRPALGYIQSIQWAPAINRMVSRLHIQCPCAFMANTGTILNLPVQTTFSEQRIHLKDFSSEAHSQRQMYGIHIQSYMHYRVIN